MPSTHGLSYPNGWVPSVGPVGYYNNYNIPTTIHGNPIQSEGSTVNNHMNFKDIVEVENGLMYYNNWAGSLHLPVLRLQM